MWGSTVLLLPETLSGSDKNVCNLANDIYQHQRVRWVAADLLTCLLPPVSPEQRHPTCDRRTGWCTARPSHSVAAVPATNLQTFIKLLPKCGLKNHTPNFEGHILNSRVKEKQWRNLRILSKLATFQSWTSGHFKLAASLDMVELDIHQLYVILIFLSTPFNWGTTQ